MYFSMRERLIMRLLSSNARASVTELAKTAKCSRPTAKRLVEKLAKEFGLRFVLEVDANMLGKLERHVLAVKFKRKPDASVLESLFKDEKYVHDVYLTEGSFDLVVIATASNPIEYIIWETKLMEDLSDYGPQVKPSDIAYMALGFIPLNDSFVNDISKEIKVDEGDKSLLQLLNHNSRMSYRELSNLSGIKEDMVRYKVFGLRRKGIIKRFTVAVQKPPEGYAIAIFENWTYNKFFEDRAAIDRSEVMNTDGEFPFLTAYQLSAPLTGSFGNFALCLFSDRREAMQKAIQKHKTIYKKDSLEIKHAKVIKALKGLLPFRNLDVKSNYVVVRWI